jgi:DNA-directed RNA polymerase specialized sigma24 family protein
LRALASQSLSGDARALRTLMVTLGPPILRVVRGVLGVGDSEVEDVAQEAMSALCGALAGFRGECTTLHFACRIAVQIAMNARRRAGYRQRHTSVVPADELAELARDDLSPAEMLAAARATTTSPGRRGMTTQATRPMSTRLCASRTRSSRTSIESVWCAPATRR